MFGTITQLTAEQMQRRAARRTRQIAAGEACPGCGAVEGEGAQPRCQHPDGCGFFNEIEEADRTITVERSFGEIEHSGDEADVLRRLRRIGCTGITVTARPYCETEDGEETVRVSFKFRGTRGQLNDALFNEGID